jgi:hypothetical protein
MPLFGPSILCTFLKMLSDAERKALLDLSTKFKFVNSGEDVSDGPGALATMTHQNKIVKPIGKPGEWLVDNFLEVWLRRTTTIIISLNDDEQKRAQTMADTSFGPLCKLFPPFVFL